MRRKGLVYQQDENIWRSAASLLQNTTFAMQLRVVAALVLLVAAGLLCGCDVNPAERIQAGNELFNQSAYAAALDAYQLAQVAAPDQPEAYFNAADALAQTGRLEKATAALNQALLTADTDLAAKAYYNLGNIYFETSHYEEAVQAYQQTLLRNPDDQDARHNLELALSRLVPPTSSPNQQAASTAGQTPTVNSPDQQGITLTPTAGDAVTPTPQPQPSTLSREEAEQRLDAIQGNQRMLRQGIQSAATTVPSAEKDW